jgi:Icc-related predicted phosphoesterase
VKVLLVSDLHYRLRQYDWLARAAVDADVVVIAGDLLDIRSAVPLEAQAVAVSAQLKLLGSRAVLLAASGNHDLDSRDAQGEKIASWLGRIRDERVHVDGESILLEDTLFTICPWWDGPLGREALDARLAGDAGRAKQRWVWVHHAPPSGSPLAWDGRREFGDEALAEWIPRFEPDLVLSGHIHQAPFVDGGGWADKIGGTWVINPGQQPGAVPTHVLIDLDKGSVDWTAAGERAGLTLRAG